MIRPVRPARVLLVAAVAGTTVAGLLAGTASATPARQAVRLDAATARHTRNVHYAVDRPACARPKRGEVGCFAVTQVPATRSTPGAYAYVAPADVASDGLTGPGDGLSPTGLATAYDYSPTTNRQGQLVAVVDWYDQPHLRDDLDYYDRYFGIPAETSRSLRIVNQRGTGRLPAYKRPASPDSTAEETSLDVEAVRAVCQTCRILLVEADSPTETDIGTAENTAARLGATEITNSFGIPEAFGASASFVDAFEHPGVAIVASNGDDGWDSWDLVNYKYGGAGSEPPATANFPATSPSVVAVGGTSLETDSSGNRTSETVWNGNGPGDEDGNLIGRQYANAGGATGGATGGGCSRYFRAPSWQLNHPGYRAAGCQGKRLSTDVSIDADPATGFSVYDTWSAPGQSAWQKVGGTSLSSPLVAALIALRQGPGSAAYAASSLYTSATVYGYDAAVDATVHDVTEGGNGYCGGEPARTCQYDARANDDAPATGSLDCSFPRGQQSVPASLDPECNAATGYDGASGIGSPLAGSLFANTAPSLGVSVPRPTEAHRAFRATASVTEPVIAAHATGYYWRFGDGKGEVFTTRPYTGHAYDSRGFHSIQLVVTDSANQVAIYHTQVWTAG